MDVLQKPEIICQIFGLQIIPHYQPKNCSTVLLIDSHISQPNPRLPQERKQAVVISGEKPDAPFYKEESRTIYEIPLGAEVTRIEICEGNYTTETNKDVHFLMMLIRHTGDEIPLQHALCILQ